MRIDLKKEAIEQLQKPVNGSGGFQSFIRRLQKNVKDGSLEISTFDLNKARTYSELYGKGGFESRLAFILESANNEIPFNKS